MLNRLSGTVGVRTDVLFTRASQSLEGDVIDPGRRQAMDKSVYEKVCGGAFILTHPYNGNRLEGDMVPGAAIRGQGAHN